MENKLKIQKRINQNKFNEALIIINNLEKTKDIDLEDYLEYRLLKSQVLYKTGKTDRSLELIDKILTLVRNQVPGNPLLLVDAIITKMEAMRWSLFKFSPTYSIKKLNGYLQLLGEGEKILENISDIEPQEKSERKVILQRCKGHVYRALRLLDCAEKCFQESVAFYKKMGNKNSIAEVLVDLADIFEIRSDHDRQLKIYQDCLTLNHELENKERIAENFHSLATVYQSKGESEKASTYVRKSLKLVSELLGTNRVTKLLCKIGSFYHIARNEPTPALDAYQKCLSVSEELANKDVFQFCLHLMGDLYQYSKGEFNRALDYYERSMTLFEETGGKLVQSWNLIDIGNLYHHQGDLDQALVHFQKALPLLEEISNDFYFCQTFLHIGRVYRSKGDIDNALDYYKRCLKLLKERELLTGQETEGLTYHELITVMLDNQDISEAKKYFKLFTQYYEKQKSRNLFLRQWYKISEALILKSSIRIRDKARALQLFQEVIAEQSLKFELLNYLADSKKIAMLNLCELHLFELKSSEKIMDENDSMEIFQEVKQTINNLASLAQQQHSFLLLIDVKILQAKLALIEGNLTKTMRLLAEAKTTTEEKELQFLYKRVNREENSLKNQLNVWENMIKRNASLKERLAQAQLEEYIVKVKRMVDLLHQ